MSTQPKDTILDFGDPDNDPVARERLHDYMRSVGIRPATDWEWADLETRVPYRPPFSLRESIRSRLRRFL